jgi:hypothetical protein
LLTLFLVLFKRLFHFLTILKYIFNLRFSQQKLSKWSKQAAILPKLSTFDLFHFLITCSNMKQSGVFEFPRGNSKTNNVHGKWTRLRTQKNIDNKNCANFISSATQSACAN